MKAVLNLVAQKDLIWESSAAKVIFGFLLLFAGAQISIPIKPVPIVLTTVGVMLIGLLYERRTAITSVISYILAGLFGLPVFQGFSGGLKHFYAPSAGYILGFLCAVIAMSYLREKFDFKTSFLGILLTSIIGTIAIFIPGVLWLSILLGPKNAILFGVMPFIIPGVVKAFILSAAIKYIKYSKD